MSEKLYYLVAPDGRVYCSNGGFAKGATKPKAYRRVKAAVQNAEMWSKYMRCRVRVVDQDGNDVNET